MADALMTRPRNDAPRTLTPFAYAVQAALDARKAALADGPRTVTELARAVGVSQSSLHQAFSGLRPLPPKTEAAICAALPELSPPSITTA